MEQSIRMKKEEYAKTIAPTNLKKAKDIISSKEYTPVFKVSELHPETEVSSDDINYIFSDIKTDLDIMGDEIADTANNFKTLLETSRLKLNAIKKTLNSEKERQEDINILCNKFTDFADVIPLSDYNTENNLTYRRDAFSLKCTNHKEVKAKILNVTGNGYEGNKYVYKNSTFICEVNNSSIRDYMTDNSPITYYEYSRITANNSEKEIFPLVNRDSINARCSILLQGEEDFNSLELEMETNDVVLESAAISIDGQNYEDLLLNDIPLNDKKNKYKNSNYIYGCGILSFKKSKFVKLVLRATSNTNDNIAFIKKSTSNEENIVELETAKRSVIRINDIKISKKRFDYTGSLILKNFLNSNVKSIAIFANEYIADSYNIREDVEYTLTINGIDYKVVPINSQDNGKKIIRTTSHTIPAEYVFYLNETIKDATLTINLKTQKDIVSPYISDLKILIGSE